MSTKKILPPIRVIDSTHLYINGYLVDTVAMRYELEQNSHAAHQEWQDFIFFKMRVKSFTEREIDATLIWWLQQQLSRMTGRRRRLFYIPDEPFIISCNNPFSRISDERVISTPWATKSEPSHRQISTHWHDSREGAMTGEWPEQRYREQAEQVRARLQEKRDAKRGKLP